MSPPYRLAPLLVGKCQSAHAVRHPPSDVLRMARPAPPEYLGGGCFVVAPVTVRERDLRALAAIVSEDRPDLPDGEGLPPSLLADLMSQIRCDWVWCAGFDSGRMAYWF